MNVFFLSQFLISFLKTIALILGLSLLVIFLLPLFGGAPYVPTPKKKVKKMLEMAELKPGEKLIDMGSGDGQILIEATKLGVQAEGYEIDPLLIWLSKKEIRKAGFEAKIKINWKSFWKADVKEADIITFYGIIGIMGKMERKLLAELKPGARVVSYSFAFSKWQPEKHESGIFLYRKS